MNDIINTIDAAVSEICACGCGLPLPADGPSAWFLDDSCQRRWHEARTTDPHRVRGSTDVAADQARWRPDLVDTPIDEHLVPAVEALLPRWQYRGSFNGAIFWRTDQQDVWHLQLDDGHRRVGLDVEALADPDVVAEVWRRLERELGDPRRLAAPDPDDAIIAEYPTFAELGQRLLVLERELGDPPRAPRRLPAPEPSATNGDLSRLLAEPGWSVVAWRRWCPHCRAFVSPRDGVHPVPMSPVDVYTVSEQEGEPLRVEPAQLCPQCHRLWPGPVLQAQVGPDDQLRHTRRVRLVAGRAAYTGHISVEMASVQEALDHLWRYLERVLLDRITHTRRCQADGCEDRARAGFEVDRRLRPDLPYQVRGVFPAGPVFQLWLCPQHEGDLLCSTSIPWTFADMTQDTTLPVELAAQRLLAARLRRELGIDTDGA